MRIDDIIEGHEYDNGRGKRRSVFTCVFDPVYGCDRVMYDVTAGPTSSFHSHDWRCWVDLKSFARWARLDVTSEARR